MNTSDLTSQGWLKDVTDLVNLGTNTYSAVRNAGKKEKPAVVQPVKTESPLKYYLIAGGAALIALGLGVMLFLGLRKKG